MCHEKMIFCENKKWFWLSQVLINTKTTVVGIRTATVTHRQLEMHGCIFINVTTNALMLMHQVISIYPSYSIPKFNNTRSFLTKNQNLWAVWWEILMHTSSIYKHSALTFFLSQMLFLFSSKKMRIVVFCCSLVPVDLTFRVLGQLGQFYDCCSVSEMTKIWLTAIHCH